MDERSQLRLEGQGEQPGKGAKSGDLYVVIHVKDHPKFKRRGADIYQKIDISFTDAALGKKIDVKTLEGNEKLKIPEGTDSGEIFRLNNNGMPRLNSRGYGDMYVEAHVLTPKKLGRRTRKILEELEKELKISKSTIVRLAQVLGYDGFHEMKSVFLKRIRHNFGPISRYRTFLSEPHEKLNFIQLISDETINNIHKTLQLIDNSQYKKAVDLLKNANHVYTVGIGISSCLAEIAAYLIGLWGIKYSVVEAIAFHHTPGKCGARMGIIVHTANILAHEMGSPETSKPARLDDNYLKDTDIMERFLVWQSACQAHIQQGENLES